MTRADDLVELGFAPCDGVLVAPESSTITFQAINKQCFRFAVYLADGTTVVGVVHGRAMRIESAERQPPVRIIHEEED